MPQETNLNVAPYFDDFDATKNYNKVLFKPAYPLQARELNNIQSILQGQIEAMGDNLFKEGSVVIPGNSSFKNSFKCIQIQSEFLGVPVNLYLDSLVGKRITGRTSGVTAKVVTYITNQQSDNNNYTLYLNYEDSSTDGNSTEVFFDDEILVTNTALAFGTSFISAGEGFANTIVSDAASTGTAFTQKAGIFFLRGNFVTVADEILILDQYSTASSYRIGFQIEEKIITADDDKSLFDNASGFNNYTAPGADRLKISASLAKKEIGEYDTQGFVQIAEVQNGQLKNAINNSPRYNVLGNELAKRTFDESGHYYITELQTKIKESLNNFEGNRGIYSPEQTTQNGSVPSDDLMIYQVSPGRAYVRGYETEVKSPQFIDVPKPRTTRKVLGNVVNFDFAPTVTVNNVNGSATIGFNTSNTLQLRDQRVDNANTYTAKGNQIGKARIYDFALESGSYDRANSKLNEWDLSLFDIDLETSITFNLETSLNKSTRVEGQTSGAVGYVNTTASSTTHSLESVKGDFIKGEQVSFGGVVDFNRYITDIRKYNFDDVKSIFGTSLVGAGTTFNADVVQVPTGFNFRTANITAASAGVSTISSSTISGNSFVGILTTGNLVQYRRPGFINPSYNRVVAVGATNFEVESVSDTTGIADGSLPSSNFDASDVQVLTAKLQQTQQGANPANNDSLYSVLPKRNVESVILENSRASFRVIKTITVTGGETGAISVDNVDSQVWLSFDEERYSVINNNTGITETLTADKITFNAAQTTLTIKGLAGTGDATLIGSINQINLASKIKRRNISNQIIINKSSNIQSGTDAIGAGGTTLNDGLTYGNYPFGTRVQDEVISLNIPDGLFVHGVYESVDVNDPQLPSLSLNNMTGATASTNDLALGETFRGLASGAKGILIEQTNSTTIGFAYLNNQVFDRTELVTFDQSGVTANVSDLDAGSPNIVDRFVFDNGQRATFYDYARIIRRGGAQIPAKKLLIAFASADYDSADTGDLTTANSYINLNFNREVASVNGFRNTDLIDVRPRVANYAVSEGANSPFEFDGRSFAHDNHSSKYIFSGDNSSRIGYNYYLGRADRVYLTKNGDIQTVLGAPSEKPTLPDVIPGAMNIANVYNPPYMYDTSGSRIKFVEHKRYQMTDIAKLEKRIKNLEYYTSLNMLEQNTLNTFVPDANGLNRFKSGIFVDNFSSFTPQDTTIGIRNSIDPEKKVLRPAHYSTAVNLTVGNNTIPGIGGTTNANGDSRFATLSGQNIKRTGNVISLNYLEVAEITQPYATRVENVTPFLVTFYEGSVALNPTVDVWVSTLPPSVNDVVLEGNFESIAESIGAEVTEGADGLRTGNAPTLWNSWQTTGVNVDLTAESDTETFAAAAERTGQTVEELGLNGNSATRSTRDFTTFDGSISLEQNRTGVNQTVTEVLTSATSIGTRITKTEVQPFMRSRNIEFTATRMKPSTNLFAFFDNVNVTQFCTPKLLEITMSEGVFQVGEEVTGTFLSMFGRGSLPPTIKFRVAAPNHKYGPYNDPTDIYDGNPYLRGQALPSSYTTESRILNVDTASLASEENPEFKGYAQIGMRLEGASSGAVAEISNMVLFTDRVGTLQGTYCVPDSQRSLNNPKFETGKNNFKLTSSSTNSSIEGSTTTEAEEIFYSQGQANTTEETTLSLRNASISRETVSETREEPVESDINFELINSTSLRPIPPPPPPPRPRGGDPLAQTFKIDAKTGMYATKVDLFFQTKDDQQPVTVQIRETSMGTPNSTIIPYSEVTLDPSKVNVSANGTAVTEFRFESPVYLEPGKFYALIILSNVTTYNVWISRLGEADVTTLATESGRVLVTSQPTLGSLFKSQNAAVWTPSQYEDLKFVLHRCDFSGAGNVQFFNPPLDETNEAIPPGGISAIPRELNVGIGTTVNQDGAANPLIVGNRIVQQNTGASGFLKSFAGIAHGDLTITSAGIGFTPSSGSFTFPGIALTTLTGSGQDGTIDITIENGIAIGATIANGGSGYTIGDKVRPVDFGNDTLGSGMELSVGVITAQNRIILTNVQGDFSTSAADYLEYDSTAGTRLSVNAGVGGSVVPNGVVVVNDGLHLKVFQRNHGMYSNTNQVSIRDVSSSMNPTVLLTNVNRGSTAAISIANTTGFDTFEHVGVSNTNPGYVKIGDEIISYEGITSGSGTAGTLTGIGRAVEGNAVSHDVNKLIFKYEFQGVSLRRINADHNLQDVTIADSLSMDSYHVKLDMNANGTNRTSVGGTFIPQTNYLTEGSTSIDGARGSYNIPYSLIIPDVTSTAPKGSYVNASVRTISETSASGSEPSFVDQGYTDVQVQKTNYFETQRMVASGINESNSLLNLPGSKSFTLNLDLLTYDKRISPMIDLNHSSIVFISNRVDGPITNFAEDPRVLGIPNDPNSMIYVSKLITLENAASSLKVFLDAYVANTSDVRLFYALDQNVSAKETRFIPFPGHNNTDDYGYVINPALSNGTPDLPIVRTDQYTQTPSVNQFRELKFTADHLQPFTKFRIKLIGTSDNQAIVPQFRNLRAISLA